MTHKSKLLLAVAAPLTLITLLFVNACIKNQNAISNTKAADSSVVLLRPDTTQSGLILPTGSRLSIHPDQPHSVEVDLPRSYLYYGTTTDNIDASSSTISITCTCSMGSDCNPYISDLYGMGCTTNGSCTVCTQVISKAKSFGQQFNQGVIVDTSTGIHFITTIAELQLTHPVISAMLHDSSVLSNLSHFLQPFQKDHLEELIARDSTDPLPSGYQLMPVSLYGRNLLVPVQASITPACKVNEFPIPHKIVNSATGEESFASSFTCSCGVGTNGCIYRYSWSSSSGFFRYCYSGVCQSCTLTITSN